MKLTSDNPKDAPMTDAPSDPQLDLLLLMDSDAVYADRVFASPQPNGLRLTFCEQAGTVPIVRSANALDWSVVVGLQQLLFNALQQRAEALAAASAPAPEPAAQPAAKPARKSRRAPRRR